MKEPTQSIPLVSVEDLRLHYRPERFSRGQGRRMLRAVDGISLEIGAGESVGMVGESGCGKTSVARVLLGLQRPTSGRVLLRGEEVDFDAPERLRQVAQMVFQDPASSLNPRLPVWVQVSEPLLGHRGLRSRARRREAAGRLLELVGLEPGDGRRFPHQFSGGQRQRIAIARALAIEPALLVADEPVASLDLPAQESILALLRELHRRSNLAMLLISHDIAGVGVICSRVLVVYMGRIMEEGPVSRVLGEGSHPYTRALLDAVPRLEERDRRERIVLEGDPPSPYSPPAGCVFHTRCPQAFDRCREEIPALFPLGDGRRSACFLHEGS